MTGNWQGYNKVNVLNTDLKIRHAWKSAFNITNSS